MKFAKKRILLVDDEAHITTLLRLLFEKTTDYEIHTENASTKALAVAEKFQPDLILLDVDMPGMDGGELANRFSSIPGLRAVPVIFVTGSVTEDEVRSRGGLIGGFPFLAKPVSHVDMLSCVRTHLAQKSLAVA